MLKNKDYGGFTVHCENYYFTTEISNPTRELTYRVFKLRPLVLSQQHRLVWDILYHIRQSGPREKGKQNSPRLLPKRRMAKTLPSGGADRKSLDALQQIKGLHQIK